jgi:hypothetical protein
MNKMTLRLIITNNATALNRMALPLGAPGFTDA